MNADKLVINMIVSKAEPTVNIAVINAPSNNEVDKTIENPAVKTPFHLPPIFQP